MRSSPSGSIGNARSSSPPCTWGRPRLPARLPSTRRHSWHSCL